MTKFNPLQSLYKKSIDAKDKKRQEFKKLQAEKEKIKDQKLKYIEKRIEKNKIYSKKNHRGQIKLSARISDLLEKIK